MAFYNGRLRTAALQRFLRFEAGDDQISFPGTLGMRGQNHFEFDAEFIIYNSAGGDVLAENLPGTSANYIFQVYNKTAGTYTFRSVVSMFPFPAISAVLNYDQKYRITVSLKTYVLRLYINGVYTSQVVCTVFTNSFGYAPLIGRGDINMDLFNIKLIAGNSLHNTNASFPADEAFTATPGTVFLFDFSVNPPTLTSVADLSGSGNNGTLQNFANPATATSGWQNV